jgi:hypothetical protein
MGLGSPFDFTITDLGNGSLAFSATGPPVRPTACAAGWTPDAPNLALMLRFQDEQVRV